MSRLVAVVVVFALTSTAAAQAPGQTPALTPRVSEKDPGAAVLISIGVTVGGFVLAGASKGEGGLLLLGLGAMYVGPSTGQWYAGRVGGIGLASRAVGAALLFTALTKYSTEGNDCLGYTDQECAAAEAQWRHDEKVAEVLGWTGIGLMVSSTLFDFVMAHRAATAWNREHQLAVTPTVLPAAGGRAPGLTLQLTF